ncbi:MAG: FAD-dependent oxidoreductase [bacterium]|nr:FAD-dependent oxidoreductase [bacterium]
MAQRITRRDFLNGLAVGVGTGLLAPDGLLAQVGPTAPGESSVYYPPTLTGMRGSHAGSFEVAHALAWNGQKPTEYRALKEHYDLVVVGAGIGGLAAAWFYRKKMGPDARILVLDNHDDFGGHAKRNEFHHDGRMLLGLGGAQNLEMPDSYGLITKGVLHDLGIDADAMQANTADDFAMANIAADNALALPGKGGHKTVGGNWLLTMHGEGDYQSMVRALPIPAAEQEKLIALFGGDRDFLDDLSLSQKLDYVSTVSYSRFLVDRVGLDRETLPILDAVLRVGNGFTGWNHAVIEALAGAAPGLQGMGWLASTVHSLAVGAASSVFQMRYFPDGNASVARLLVHKLIPEVAFESSAFEDIATSRFLYEALDRDKNATRLRLNSTVVGVRNVGDEKVEIDYVRNGEALRVTGGHCILACYNGLISHLCPELPDKQKDALRYGVKVPLVYANVLLDNGRAFSKLGGTLVTCPKDPFTMLSCAPATTTGGYEPPRGPDDPMVVLMMANPTPEPTGDESLRDLLRIGRATVYATPFGTYEQQVRDQLQSVLGPHGFDHETDIRAITVNRWPHGYAYWYMMLDDPEWPEGEAPHEIGRAQFGRISIANSDAEARPYMDAAIEAGWRAVTEQTL